MGIFDSFSDSLRGSMIDNLIDVSDIFGGRKQAANRFVFSNSDRGIGFGGNTSGTLSPARIEGRDFDQTFFGMQPRVSTKLFQIPAPPLIWGFWQEIFAQFGVADPNADSHVTRITVSFSSFSRSPSSFDYEIKGGDHFISGVAGASGASEIVNITGNVATAISIRAKSHSVGQNVMVTVS